MGPKKNKQRANRALQGLQPIKKPKRSELSAGEKLTVLNWHHGNGRNQVHTARHFQAIPGFETLNQGTVSRWIRDEDRIQELVHSERGQLVRQRAVRNKEFEACMAVWVDQMEACEFSRLSGEAIRQVAIKLYDKLGTLPEARLELSNGWLNRFLGRHGLSMQTFHGEASSAPSSLIQPKRERVADVIANFLAADPRRSLQDVFNVDETSFFYAQTPDQGLARTSRPGVKQNRTRITLALTINATGDERLDPLFIGRHHKPRCFERKSARDLGFQYTFNSTAWMTKDIFTSWLSTWNYKLVQPVSNIELLFFTPNLTAHVQPCDGGVVRAFKALYRRRVVLRTVDRLFSGNVTADLFKIDQLSAMRIAKLAWKEVTNEAMANCWKHVGILPGSPEVGEAVDMAISEGPAIQDLKDALSLLRESATSIGRSLLLMSADSFVDLDHDEATGAQLTIDEIVQSVQSAQKPLSSDGDERLEVSERADDLDHVHEVLRPDTVYKSLLAIEQYCEDKMLDISDDVSVLLHRIRRELRHDIANSKKQKTIHDYFKASAPSSSTAI